MGLMKPTLALVGSSLLGAVASHAPQVADVFSVEWALDSGAGEHLVLRGSDFPRNSKSFA